MKDRINRVLKRVFDLTDADLAKDLTRTDIAKWDSLTHMDLVVSLEQEFQMNFTIDEIIAIDSIAKVRSILREKGVS